MKFNTAIAALMTLTNDFYKAGAVTKQDVVTFVQLLSPFAPHLTEELWQQLGMNPDGKTFCTLSAWPVYDAAKTVDATIKMGVQINGKVRASIELPADASKEQVLETAKQDPNVAKYLEGGQLVKEIYVPGKILNFVVK